VKVETEADAVRLQSELNSLVKREVDVMSAKQMKELLYEEMNLAPQYKKRKDGKTTLTADEEAIEKLARQNPSLSPIFDKVLGIRKDRKILGTYIENLFGEDGRARCSYIIGGDDEGVGGTETGRLSSRESIFGTGTNLQNVPPGNCRKMFVPDEGRVFVEPDLSQAEARVVAYLAEEERMIEVFDGGGDIHQLTADSLPKDFVPSGSAYQNVSNPLRLFAKKHVHAFNYGEGTRTFAMRAGVSMATAMVIRDGYFSAFPRIVGWHYEVQAALKRSRVMSTPMGRKRTFFGRWGDELFREAYAFVPQSTVADILNLALIRFEKSVPTGCRWELMLQVHDAFVLQCPKGEVERCMNVVRSAFDIPVYVKGRVLKIPIEVKVGENWQEMKKVTNE
jgi:DNA polymerase-1